MNYPRQNLAFQENLDYQQQYFSGQRANRDDRNVSYQSEGRLFNPPSPKRFTPNRMSSSNINQSFASSLDQSSAMRSSQGPATPSSNSKAVISALRSLQDKIRALEQERQQYQQDVYSLQQERMRESTERRGQGDRISQREEELLQQAKELEELQKDHYNRKRRDEELLKSTSKRVVDNLKNKVYELESELDTMKEKYYQMEFDHKLAQQQLEQYQSGEYIPITNRRKSSNSVKSSNVTNSSTQRAETSQKKRTASVQATTSSRNTSFNPKVSNLAVNKSTEMPFVVGKPGAKSFHVPSNVQKAMAMVNVHMQTSQINEERKRRSPSSNKSTKPQPCSKADQPTCASSGIPHEDRLDHIEQQYGLEGEYTVKKAKGVSNADMAQIIRGLEEEYDELNKEYHNLILDVRNTSGHPDDLETSYLNNNIQHIIEKLEAKADQIKKLKQYYRSTVEQLKYSPKKSPVVIGKHLKAVKVLHNLQDINSSSESNINNLSHSQRARNTQKQNDPVSRRLDLNV